MEPHRARAARPGAAPSSPLLSPALTAALLVSTAAVTALLAGCSAGSPAAVSPLAAPAAGAPGTDAAVLLDAHTLALTLVGTADCPAEVVGARESVGGEVVVDAAGHGHHTCAGPAEAASWRITTRADLTVAGGPRAVTVYRADRVLSVPVTGAELSAAGVVAVADAGPDPG